MSTAALPLVVFLICTHLSISFGWMRTHQLRYSRSTTRYCPFSMSSSTPPIPTRDRILRKVDKWACISNCGACCKLGTFDFFVIPQYATKFIDRNIQALLNQGPI